MLPVGHQRRGDQLHFVRNLQLMRILIVHNRYQQPGGEDAAVGHEQNLLRAAGHDVALAVVGNQSIETFGQKARAAYHAAYSPSGLEWMRRQLGVHRPDLVQAHNVFPLLTPSIYDACEQAAVPVIQTLHNFRVTCAAATLLRQGSICEKCIGNTPYWAAIHRCYRDSLAGSLVMAHMIDFHRRRGTWRNKVQLFFALTEFARQKYIAAGVPGERIAVKPNYAPLPPPLGPHTRRGGLFVGRLSVEKGVEPLLAAWRGIDYPLTIVGDGPLREKLFATATPNVIFRGRLKTADVCEEMSRAAFLVVPSVCYEMLPMVIIEAFASGLPVFASRIGGLPELINDGADGKLFTCGDVNDIARVVSAAVEDPTGTSSMGVMARRTYDAIYSADAVYKVQIAAYERVLSQAAQDGVDRGGIRSTAGPP